jgi:hypothetical protein
MRTISLTVVFLMLAVIEVAAQGKSGTVRATVLDQKKALLRDASITLTNVDLQVKSETGF